jgi:hypothetical protein
VQEVMVNLSFPSTTKKHEFFTQRNKKTKVISPLSGNALPQDA